MKIPEMTIKKIIEKADIVDIISSHIKLEKKGADYKGLCPFHNDSTPSLSVSPSKKIFKCFSCGTAGNVIKFVQDYEHIPYPQAVVKVAKTVGIEIDNLANDNFFQNNQRYFKIMQDASKFYSFYLKNTQEGQVATKYLYDRKLNVDIINRFNIGLSSSEANLLYKDLSKKYSELDLIEVGLIKKGSNYYDVFRGRIVFPIEDLQGNIVGFSGRIYNNNKKDEPKYVNSAENIIFKKGNILYNYYASSNDIKRNDSVFVFEGFMDVIAAYRAGINNAVATMGTALTFDQINALGKLTKNIILCYDGDKAGINATKRAIKMFTQSGFNIKIILIPDDMDPDDYINKYGNEALNNYLNNSSVSAFEYLYEIEKKNLIVEDLNSAETFKNNIFKILNFYNSTIINVKAFQLMSNDLQIDEKIIEQDYYKSNTLPEYTNAKKETIISKRELYEKRKFIEAEKKLISIAYYDKNKFVEIKSYLKEDHVDINNHNIMLRLTEYYDNNDNLDEEIFNGHLSQQELELITNILNTNIPLESEKIELLVNTVSSYKNEKKNQILKSSEKLDQTILAEFSKNKQKLVTFNKNNYK